MTPGRPGPWSTAATRWPTPRPPTVEARFSGRVMRVRLGMFERPGARLERAIEEGFGGISVLLGARDLIFP